MRNIDLASAYKDIYENRRAARAAGGYKDDSPKQTDPSKDNFTGISGSIKEIMRQNKEIEAKNKAKKEETEVDGEQLDEVAPLIAAAAGGLAKAGAAKAATAGAAKMGGGLAKAAGSKMGKAAINAGSTAVGNSVERKMSEETEQLDEKEGKKDACYNKVKSRYSVWPSAYASGALVKCRQKGAANWGNSSKKEEVEAVFATLIGEKVAHDEESAINIISHMSDGWYDSIVEQILAEG